MCLCTLVREKRKVQSSCNGGLNDSSGHCFGHKLNLNYLNAYISSGYYARTCSEFNVCGPLSPLASPPSAGGCGSIPFPSLQLCANLRVWAGFVQLYIFLPFVLPATSIIFLPLYFCPSQYISQWL